ncbi:DUF1501 domain-containing protein [Winogradskyella alexanderae]|uniref:DUF1501 domain-containing protein n=1 Tax=Winogradskyella alexanderae TaxID=2877123 RepID=A0ABS7XMB3_9FLAO|nr:DUF1501 domain-containing protein [Winogradskyella alexanderae]MCA0131116.1 DUF1501 domain-containing protein [Winogradskyella alexanderae]
MKRREFIRNSSLATSALLIPNFLKVFENADPSKIGHKKLVIVHLKGGNDGLNTIVPVTNDIYYRSRPKIGIKKSNTLKLNDELGFNENLKPLKELYDKGYLSIINNVGYPNPSRSHFTSSEIWQTASDHENILDTGWVGRYLDHYGKKPYNAIHVDDHLSLALRGASLNGIAVKNSRQLYMSLQESDFNEILSHYSKDHLTEHNLGYLYQTMIDAKSSAKYLYDTALRSKLSNNYPKNSILANQLKVIGQFINSRLDTSVYYASLSGFDTHSAQKSRHNKLLTDYSEALLTFVEDLKLNNTFKDTLILTFTEFGRRVKQNYSDGTDHGAANNLFIVGNNLKRAGLYNLPADLKDLDDNGDLKYEIDFREVYATIIDKWLNVDDRRILNRSFSKLNFI